MRDGLADWVDPAQKPLGIVAREMLPRSEPVFAPEPLNPALPPAEVHGLHFEDPEKNSEILAERTRLVTAARMVTYFGPAASLVELGQE